MVLRSQRVFVPCVLTVLLVFQLGYLYGEKVRARVPLYTGIYTVQMEDLPFLPSGQDLKRLVIQAGAHHGLGLADQDADVGIAQQILRVMIRSDRRYDWASFFVIYGRDLRSATLARWETARLANQCTCRISPITFRGWTTSHTAWLKPLDLVSLAVLATTLVLWLTGRRPVHTE